MTSLLPPNSTQLERAAADSQHLDQLPVELRHLWSAEHCPAQLLPYLAWTLSVDFWELASTEQQQRALIAGAIAWHRKRGTPWAIRQALAAIGYPVLELIEQADYHREWLKAGGRTLDGSWRLDGQQDLMPPENAGSKASRRIALNHWAEYAIRLNAMEGNWSREQQVRIRRIAEAYAPTRSRLVAIISSLAARFGSHVRAIRMKQKVRVSLAGCQRAQPLQRRTLDGCWPLGGETGLQILDGQLRLDGSRPLNGQRLIASWAWAAGHARVNQRLRLRLTATVGTGSTQQPRTLAPRPLLLDGLLRLDSYTLQGWQLDEGITLGAAGMNRLGLAKLDGTWRLGPRPRASRVRARVTARIRQNGIITQVAI